MGAQDVEAGRGLRAAEPCGAGGRGGAAIAIRMALGAKRRDVVRLVVGRARAPALAGVAVGLAAALGLTPFMESVLYEVSTVDPLIFVAVPALLAAVALLACVIPALRAARVDPLVALRSA